MVFGLFGALANLIIFSRRRFRKTSNAQYILVQPLIIVVILSFVLFATVAIYGFAMPLFYSKRAVCVVVRNYTAIVSSQVSLYYNCLLAFD
jgi:hypothetical protein